MAEISSTNCTFKRLQSSKATPRSLLLEAAGCKAEITVLYVYTVYSVDEAQYQQGRCGMKPEVMMEYFLSVKDTIRYDQSDGNRFPPCV